MIITKLKLLLLRKKRLNLLLRIILQIFNNSPGLEELEFCFKESLDALFFPLKSEISIFPFF